MKFCGCSQQPQNTDTLQNQINEHCIKPVPYKGYVSIWCGDGAVIFRGSNGDKVKGYSNSRDAWLEPAWLQAKAEIDAKYDCYQLSHGRSVPPEKLCKPL